MRIVHVANFYGQRSHLSPSIIPALGAGYTRAGHSFTAIVPGAAVTRRTDAAGTIITVPAPLHSHGRRSFAATERVLLDQVRQLDPDVLEIADRFGSGLLTRWARTAGVPSVLIAAGAFPPGSRGSVATRGVSGTRPAADRIVQVTATHALTRDHASGRVHRVHPGVDLAEFTPLRWSTDVRDHLLGGEETLLTYAGPLELRHEPRHALEALRTLRDRGVTARLLVIGSGPLENRLRAESAGLAVDFVNPNMPPRAFAQYLASSDAVLLPGLLESVVHRGLEALASGTPVVFAEGSPLREVAGSRGGEAAASETGAFAGAVERVLARRVENRRMDARERASLYPWQATVDGILAVHTQLHRPTVVSDDASTDRSLLIAGDRPTPSDAVPS